ncbi:MAG: carboxylating nicotinate-nucleotide diphosphorylase [Gammaproteobacteria bacterium]|nr:carboxylating nicotinate-nucleotide diphosphorylase [Gammaproteobacteria bacterium]MCY4283479.1 carboxylating nicotinate-nucleotide diphosphorylase [Gammaproteobacteria bacterium]MCY4337258.1 carboxylating nicotinate-nucleotide diphosphorylase [Gammaproteobacteria bacterium]
MNTPALPADIGSVVRRALNEDLGTGDLTAGLVPAQSMARARVICRERALLCGAPWFDEVYRQLDERVRVDWHSRDGAALEPEQTVCTLSGPAAALLSGERTALNFLQLLSGTATVTGEYVALIAHSATRLLDTRKTLPGLRSAQKYAVLCGGGDNHRMGLYDAILIKENHIRACGSVSAALAAARKTRRTVEIEVENETQLKAALAGGADIVMLDNFSLEQVRRAVQLNNGRARLEVSGGIDRQALVALAATGVDCISVGALTKHVRAVDFSMLVSAGS